MVFWMYSAISIFLWWIKIGDDNQWLDTRQVPCLTWEAASGLVKLTRWWPTIKQECKWWRPGLPAIHQYHLVQILNSNGDRFWYFLKDFERESPILTPPMIFNIMLGGKTLWSKKCFPFPCQASSHFLAGLLPYFFQASSHIKLLHAINLPIHHSSRISRE